jgi:hypothetical protein
MAFKYKIKEAPAPNLAKQGNYKIGDITYSKDGNIKYTVNSIDPESGQVGWNVVELPSFEKLNETADELVATAKKVYTKTKDDEKFKEIYEDARLIRNKIRRHLRNEYPDEYKRMTMEGEVEEMSTSGGAGAYLTPYAFRKKGAKADDEAYTELGYTLAKEGKLGDGADLGPGPKATEDGVKDNAYVKQFKYKLVPKDKNGNYVQKGSGLEVKNLF